MTVATTGQAMQNGVGWCKAPRTAITDNSFVKGEGFSPKARRELLGHSHIRSSHFRSESVDESLIRSSIFGGHCDKK
ncbi:hypothetical protein ACCAA_180024 [Candidatus Accumulibacter aalborgensis]|uniref:Uncharacterized protein n=1 Tax=Candidatus Accumulibacter aalborgensis TaxID=1860102 RepID=A0A1A8XJ58_9PROT|nr:hypothetical protein [Candidatus Accumulibacter aalborgensis]SBT04731.1 hypothetical protein ACCAA_180024 [Candidatus Accumulibacter aalborgensis]